MDIIRGQQTADLASSAMACTLDGQPQSQRLRSTVTAFRANHDHTENSPQATEVRWYPNLLRLLSASEVPAVSADARPRTLGVDAERLIMAGIVPLIERRLRWIFPGSGGDFSGAPLERSASFPKVEGSTSVIWTGDDGVFWSNGELNGAPATCG